LKLDRKRQPPRWLHLATHGFFDPGRLSPVGRNSRSASTSQLSTEDVTVRNPLLLSGLVLAGANSDPDRGILTAEEAALLDLRGCELVVLSACQTGLGPVTFGEGLLGLQRAFSVAGAKSVAASLWSVPDKATQELMTRFYANLWNSKGQKLSKLE